jgi:hypothetical protein
MKLPRAAITVLLGATAMLMNCKPSGSSRSSPNTIPSAARQEAASTLERWNQVRTLLSNKADRVETACDDKSLSVKHSGAPGRVLLVDSRYLARFESPCTSPYQGADSYWQLLTHSKLRAIDPNVLRGAGPGFVDTLLAARALAQFADYWGVLETSERRLPQVDSGGFQPSSVSGWLLVIDPKTPRLMCQTKITATSSQEVARSARVDAEKAVRRDFSVQLRNGLDAALHSISRQLVLVAD